MADPPSEFELAALQTADPPAPSDCELEALHPRPSDIPHQGTRRRRHEEPGESPPTRIFLLGCCLGLILVGGLSLALRHPASTGIDGAPTPLGAPPSPTSRAYHRISASLGENNFNATKKFSFVHISKCAGATFIRLLKDAPLNVCPRAEAGFEQSAWHQHHASECQDSDYKLVSLRSPRHHVYSLFTECKYDKWGRQVTKNTGFPRTNDTGVECRECDERDIDQWLGSFLPMGPNTEGYYRCYHPANYQSRALTSHSAGAHGVSNHQFEPDIDLAKRTYREFDWVALADFVHQSRCLLYYRLGPEAPASTIAYLDSTCRCLGARNAPNPNSVHVSHHALGHRAILRDLPPDILEKVKNLTEVDAQLYKLALGEFMAKIAWLESDLGRRVLCDDVLDRWEPELAYMNVSVTELYSVVSGIASGSAPDADSSGVDWMFDEDPVCNPIQTNSAQCTQVNNLGRTDTPLECARRMANFSYCGDLFLFSTAHPERGCQCCSLGDQNETATGIEEWAYSAAECTAQDAPSSHRRD
ncbi:hypothetical protein ACHAXT_012476 [Thalassiosira profunda]